MQRRHLDWKPNNKIALGLCLIFLGQAAHAELNTQAIREEFASPGVASQPRTRWWWMGNPITKDDITWQLESMRSKGIVGVEQISMSRVYEKGNVEYMSDAFIDLLKHAVAESNRLGMKFSLNFGGPGWVIGWPWVPQEDRSRCMVPTHLDLEGSSLYEGPLPTSFTGKVGRLEVAADPIAQDDIPLAVVAARLDDGRLDPESLIDLTGRVGEDRQLSWRVPPGEWRLTCFWLRFTRHGHAVDHFNKAAMERYCEALGTKLVENFGENLGENFESMFCDSFEVAMLPNSIYWSEGLLELFQERKGYDLTRFLPAIWFEVGDLSPKIRYDVNEFLHEVGLEAFFEPFLEWCSRHGVQGRIQPYGFTTDNIEAAGTTHIPEMEITAGEKDAVPWFDTRIGPKKYVASGAHLYGRNIVSVEAHTYLHWEPYRATLEELKIVSDVFLRYGANLFFNIGYTATPERAPAPSRTFYSAVRISHQNVWWDHYPLLGDYVARCCSLLQKGDFTADIAVYSPLANQWTLDVRNPRKWTRGFQWGGLGGLLIANGYDFDLLNDDILQNRAVIADKSIRVRNLRYRILVLPNVEAIPLETMEFVRDFVDAGGAVIALERVPDSSVGYKDHREQDEAVRAIADRMFGIPEGWNGITGRRGRAPVDYGQGRTYTLTRVLDRSNPLDLYSSTLDPFLRILRRHCQPDFGIDFANLDSRRNEGLTFVHRTLDDTDIYFVTNVQDEAIRQPIAFRVTGKVPWKWNPYDGHVSRVWQYRMGESATEVPMVLGPYESTFIVFEPGDDTPHVTETNLDRIVKLDPAGTLEALATENGPYAVTVKSSDERVQRNVIVQGLPAPFRIRGRWNLELAQEDETLHRGEYEELRSWTESEETKHFSGTGTYRISFDLPAEYIQDDIALRLSPGKVGNLAAVVLNGTELGTCWIRGQSLDATGLFRRTNNELVVKVVNTLINRVAGWDELPPVPAHLFPRLGNGINDKSPHYQILLDFDPLPPSGLLGPVRILPTKKIRLKINEK